MIEVIYDKNKNGANDKRDATEKESAVSIGLKLPKNIRQIGNPTSNKRIYIEDYVVTYLNYISRPGSTSARGAILLGECKKSDLGDVIFISGAVDAENLEFDMDESEFTQEAWSAIYDQVKEFFPELTVVGWFLSRMGFSTGINSKIEKMHVDNFPGKDKVLYVMDSLENEDAFYMFEKGQLVKQKGYYIYYSRNEAMQSYIVKKRGGMPVEQNSEIHRKDEELIKNFREKNPIKKINTSKNNIGFAYVAGAFLVLGMLVMGVTVISNNDKMKDMEVSINRMKLTAEDGDSEVTAVMSNNDDVPIASPADVVAPKEKETANENNIATDTNSTRENITTESVTTEEETKASEEPEISTEQTLPAITGGNPTYYTIEYGDSLSTIAEKYYGSIIYAEEIAKANNLKIDDKIYEGQSIIIPSIKVSQ